MLRQGVPHSDGNYEQELLVNVLNNELANTLGNLLNRVTAKSVNLNQNFGSSDMKLNSKEAESVKECVSDLVDRVERHYSDFNFYLGIDEINECLRKVYLLT